MEDTENSLELINKVKQRIRDYNIQRLWFIPLILLGFVGLFFTLYLCMITSFYWYNYILLGLNSYLSSKATVVFLDYRYSIKRLKMTLCHLENIYQKENKGAL